MEFPYEFLSNILSKFMGNVSPKKFHALLTMSIASSVMCSHAMDADFSFFELAVGSFVEAAVLMGKVVQC